MISDERLDAVAKMKTHPMVLPPNHNECIEMAKELLAYRKAFSDPFCFTDTAGVELCRQGVSFEAWPHIDAVIDSNPLYRKPTIPE